MIILPRRRALFTGVTAAGTWADWDETSEAGLASDDIFVCLMQNTVASGNETGEGGGLTGANLVLTQVGGIAGATGSPPRRALAASDYFTWANDAIVAMFAQGTWSIILKVDLTSAADDTQFIYFGGPLYNWLSMIVPNTTDPNKLKLLYDDNGVGATSTLTVNDVSAGVRYYAAWGDGTTAYAGFTATRPTKKSDFAAGNFLTASLTLDFSNGTWPNVQELFGGTSYGDCIGDAYYVVISKTCLIDNAS